MVVNYIHIADFFQPTLLLSFLLLFPSPILFTFSQPLSPLFSPLPISSVSVTSLSFGLLVIDFLYSMPMYISYLLLFILKSPSLVFDNPIISSIAAASFLSVHCSPRCSLICKRVINSISIETLSVLPTVLGTDTMLIQC